MEGLQLQCRTQSIYISNEILYNQCIMHTDSEEVFLKL